MSCTVHEPNSAPPCQPSWVSASIPTIPTHKFGELCSHPSPPPTRTTDTRRNIQRAPKAQDLGSRARAPVRYPRRTSQRCSREGVMNPTNAATTHVRRGSRAAPSLLVFVLLLSFPRLPDVQEAEGGRWRLKTDSADGLALVGLGEGVDRPYEPGLPRRGCCLDVVAFGVRCSFSWTSELDISWTFRSFSFRSRVWTLCARCGTRTWTQTRTRTDSDSDADAD